MPTGPPLSLPPELEMAKARNQLDAVLQGLLEKSHMDRLGLGPGWGGFEPCLAGWVSGEGSQWPGNLGSPHAGPLESQANSSPLLPESGWMRKLGRPPRTPTTSMLFCLLGEMESGSEGCDG